MREDVQKLESIKNKSTCSCPYEESLCKHVKGLLWLLCDRSNGYPFKIPRQFVLSGIQWVIWEFEHPDESGKYCLVSDYGKPFGEAIRCIPRHQTIAEK